MAERTAIAWTDHTWSPWWGCTQVSPACDHCFAMALDHRFGGDHWGPGKPRRELSEAHWCAPLKWDRAAEAADATRFVFPSMCDPFDNEVPHLWRRRFFDLIRATPHLTWLLLTKRIGNAAKMAAECGGLPENAAAGATVVTQAEADRDIPKLLALEGPRFRFLSVEPMLESLVLEFIGRDWLFPLVGPRRLDWIICGGESGPGARPMQAEWARSLRDQCVAAGVPFFFKQWGGKTPTAGGKLLDGREWCERPSA
jgi:protein gp37